MNTPDKNQNYDRKTIITAAGIFIGFCAVTYFLPTIMTAVGTSNQYLTGGIIAAFLVLPFVGLWLRGRNKSKHKD
ncbi:hypothetical protein WNY59_15770 [Ahrensia kielensis]|uniref:Uncharacterized protein n=1 Tax=Ahrensia kielensis TaxID=76980 RepID=A0ABU9TBJ6_9HYPH|nr:hypothetical protein [Ahrensia sp. 13_GOM-1096m]